MNSGLILYPAAALFCARESIFNVLLLQQLEREYGHKSFLPQRDGFEFSKLAEVLKRFLELQRVSSALEDIIYLADMGLFIPRSQVIFANLDEPLDPGVLIEIGHARALGKLVVGFRTDVRSLYGEFVSPLRGIHFFPAYQCHAFLFRSRSCSNQEDIRLFVNELAASIQAVIQARYAEIREVHQSIEVGQLISMAEELFNGLNPLNSLESLEVIATRYCKMQERIALIRPVVQ
jgi:nucleoside 2-deoxyribosyltransferase